MNKITSTTNQKIKYLVSLNKKNIRDKEKQFMIEGDDLIADALVANCVKEIFTTNENYINDDVDVTYITDNVMKKISNMKSLSDKVALCEFLNEKDVSTNKVIYLDGVQDPGNVGTIIRTASSFGYSDIILSEKCADIYNDKTLRSTKGALFNVNISRSNKLDDLKNNGYQIISSSLEDNSFELGAMKKHDKFVIVFGSEGQGISKEIKEKTDTFVKIAMESNDSLNVGVAAGIILDYLRR